MAQGAQDSESKATIIFLVVVVLIGLGVWGGWVAFGNKLKARDKLNQGARAFKAAQYTQAIENFKLAIQLDPQLQTARLYLATAYANQFIPGAESDDNIKMGMQAIDEFKKVLADDPSNVNSVAGIASIYFNMKKFEEAKQWYGKQIQLDPKNAEAYYSIGVIDWSQTYPARMEARSAAKLDPQGSEPFKDAKARDELCTKNTPLIEEGFKHLNKAVEINPQYDDAMAYINLMYREKADCEADLTARKADLDSAESWVTKLMEVKRIKAEAAAKAPSGQITK
jgi:tetratricopeptide (TPR) repeat protein